MGKDLFEKISEINEKAKALEIKKKLLKEKEKQKFQKIKLTKFQTIGKLAEKSGILEIDELAIFGAFLEIKELSSTKEKMEFWKAKGEKFSPTKKITDEPTFSISFKNPVGGSEKRAMKLLSFRYNKFRKEFYGYGKEKDIRSQLNDFEYSLEVIENN